MKLLYIANIRLPSERAHTIQIMKMCEAFADTGATVELVVTNLKSSIQEDLFSFYGIKRNFVITRVSVPNTMTLGRVGFWFETIFFAVIAMHHSNRISPDVIYSRDEKVLFFLSIMQKMYTPFVWESHGENWGFLVKRVVKKACKIVVTSKRLKVIYSGNGVNPDKIIAAGHAIDQSMLSFSNSKKDLRISLGLPKERKIIAYIGRYSATFGEKGIDGLIEAFEILTRTSSNNFLLIVGLVPNEIAYVTEYAKRIGLDSSTYLFCPYIPHKIVFQYLRAADVLVMNYPNIRHFSQIMSPLKLLEYMASGNPIVSTDLPSIREILDDDSCYFIMPDNTQSLADGISQALQDGKVDNKADRARSLVSECTWESRARYILSNLTVPAHSHKLPRAS